MTVIAVIFLPNVALGTQTAIEKRASEKSEGGLAQVSAADVLEEAEDLTIESASAVAGLPAVGSSRPADYRDRAGD